MSREYIMKSKETVRKHKRKNHEPSQESLDLSATDPVKPEQVDDRVKSLTSYKSVKERRHEATMMPHEAGKCPALAA